MCDLKSKNSTVKRQKKFQSRSPEVAVLWVAALIRNNKSVKFQMKCTYKVRSLRGQVSVYPTVNPTVFNRVYSQGGLAKLREQF